MLERDEVDVETQDVQRRALARVLLGPWGSGNPDREACCVTTARDVSSETPRSQHLSCEDNHNCPSIQSYRPILITSDGRSSSKATSNMAQDPRALLQKVSSLCDSFHDR